MCRMTTVFLRRTSARYQSFNHLSIWWMSSSSHSEPNLLSIRQSMEILLGRKPIKFVSFLDDVDQKMYKNRNHYIGGVKKLEETSSKVTVSSTQYILDKGPPISQAINNERPPDFDSSKAYDKDLFEQYKDVIIEHILASPKFHTKSKNVSEYQTVCDWLLLNYKQVEYTLPLLRGDDTYPQMTHNACNTVRGQLKEQQDKFISIKGFTPNQMSLLTAALTALSRYCAKRNQIVPLMVGWEKIKEAGIMLSEEEASTFLYVFGNSSALYSSMLLGSSRLGDLLLQNYGSSPSSRASSVSEILDGSNCDKSSSWLLGNDSTASKEVKKETNIPAEVATYHDLLYKPTERSISIRVKALVSKGDAHGAQNLLDFFPVS